MSNFSEKNREDEQPDVQYIQSNGEQDQEIRLELDPVDPIDPVETIDVSLNNTPMALEQARDNALLACDCEDYSVYDYEIMDEAMVLISNYDAGPRDDYGDDMYD